MRVLVTGGAGFIGSHLCDRLIAEGHEVIAVDNLITGRLVNITHLDGNPRFTFIKHDVTEPLDLPVDQIYHLASPASPTGYMRHPIETHLVNSIGTLNMLRLALARGARFLFTSTSETYGDPHVHPQPETYHGNVNPVGPRSCYDESKRFGESITMEFVRRFSLDARIVRIFNTYGPRMRIKDARQTFLGIWIRNLIEGNPIKVFGDGSQIRDFNYIDDVVDALLLTALSDDANGKVYNLGAEDKMSLAETARLLTSFYNNENYQMVPFPENRKSIDIGDYWADFGLIQRELGWTPRVPLAVGLRNTLEYFEENINYYR